MLVILFKYSDQFVPKKLIGLQTKINHMQQLSLSNNMNEEEKITDLLFEAIGINMKGLSLWAEIERKNYLWNVSKKRSGKKSLIEIYSKKKFYEIFKMISTKNEFLLTDDTIPNVIALGVKDSPMNEEDLEATIDFFLELNFYPQLACLITHQKNPPITADHFKNVSTDTLAKVFEFLFIMSPEKLNIFFNNNVTDENLYLISPLVSCYEKITEKFYEIIETMIQSKTISNHVLVGFACHGIISSYNEAENSQKLEKIFHRNEDLLNYFYSKINDGTFTEDEVPFITETLKFGKNGNLARFNQLLIE